MKDLEFPDLIAIVVALAFGYALVRFVMYEPPTCPNGQVAVRDESSRYLVCIMGRQP